MSDFTRLTDLAAERLGGAVLWATDDFFAPKENLLKPGRGEFIPGKYTERGKWMDGWESRRKRTPGHDWCVVRLGLSGVVRGVDVDTNHFLGNAPRAVALDACRVSGAQSVDALVASNDWTPILAETAVQPGSQNLFAIEASSGERWTHLRFHIFPDGGVARLRVHGDVVPDWERLCAEQRVLDLATVEHGGVVVASSDEFFSDRRNLILPGTSLNMGDGWETRRRRGPGHDWTIVRLGRPGALKRIELYTTHYKGNYPDTCSIEACRSTSGDDALASAAWSEIVPRTKLEAHARHDFAVAGDPAATHVRLNIFPDGGVARLRVYGAPLP